MRLNRYISQLKEDGEIGGGTVTTDIAQYQPKLTLADRRKQRKIKFKRKSKLLG